MSGPPSSPHPQHENSAYCALLARLHHAGTLDSAVKLLDWDQRVVMPGAGVASRAAQRAELAHLVHERWADPAVGDWLDACEADPVLTGEPDSDSAVILREARRLHERARRLPDTLVRELAEARTTATHLWREARAESDFARFRPALERLVSLLQHKARCLGSPQQLDHDRGEAWDALADHFEPGCTARQVSALFDELMPRLRHRLEALPIDAHRTGAPFHHAPLPGDAQLRFMRFIAERFGFDFQRGRLDPTVHPFCAGIAPGDVRLTVRYREDDLRSALASISHETGHGLYEQGLPATHFPTPLCSTVSLGIHESQSRLWENHVARSHAFCRWCAAEALPKCFGDAPAALRADVLFEALNRVGPSLIRTDADELTYHLHITVRFELERAMLEGDLAVADLPEAWNEAYQAQLHIDVPDDRRGCLQDVHWSMGAIGYFPTYTLGSLYAAQFFETAEQAIGDTEAMFARGEFAPLLNWLREHVHRHGRRYSAELLCRRVTGASLSIEPLLRHLDARRHAVEALGR